MPTITFQNTQKTVEAKPNQLLKEVIQNQDWPIPFACENGICGTCLIKVTQGKENINPVEEQEKMTLEAMGAFDGDHRLACQCRVQGDIEVAA